MIGVYSESSCFHTMFKSKLVTEQNLLEDVHEESLHIPKPNQPVPVQPSRRAFEGVRTLGQSLFNTKLHFRS
jgi:hypothetical protein